jgi:phosphatidate cytidylyltransferase|tara:strand:+ start:620 stop:1264 length:645 start_codon:yes stop_codon:yes gene_type:complete
MSINLKKRIYTSIILFLIIYLIISFNFFLLFILIVLGNLSILEFFNISKRIIKNKFNLFFINTIFSLYIFLFCILFFYFSNILYLKIILFSLLFGCIASDVGGYVFGKFFKGPKLTKISPKKTITGSIGSIIFTIVIITFLFFYITNSFSYYSIIIAILTSLSCQVGDLFFSYLKRKAKIKDTGNFLPGHGGILDRLDGILLAIPLSVLSLTLF